MSELKEVVRIFDVRNLRIASTKGSTKKRSNRSRLFDNNDALDFSSLQPRWWPVESNEENNLVRVR